MLLIPLCMIVSANAAVEEDGDLSFSASSESYV